MVVVVMVVVVMEVMVVVMEVMVVIVMMAMSNFLAAQDLLVALRQRSTHRIWHLR